MTAPNPKETELSTPAILHGGGKALHLLKNPAMEFVSSVSRWKDIKWELDEVYPGSNLYWDIKFDNGSLLTDPIHFLLLDSTRRFIWSLLSDPVDRDAIPISSASGVLSACRPLLFWMVNTHRIDFSELVPSAFEEFLDHWMAIGQQSQDFDGDFGSAEDFENSQEGDIEEEDSLSFSSLYKAVTVWKSLWNQTPTLINSAIPTMVEDPLQRRSALDVTNQVIAYVLRVTPPLPDEVALPIMNEAQRWLGCRADDIIRLHEMCMKAFVRSADGDGGALISKADAEALFSKFYFSVEPGAVEPWHEPVEVRIVVYTSEARKSKNHWFLPSVQVRELVDDLLGSCLIVLQSESGLRPGEIRTLEAGVDSESRHNCLHSELSISGLNELFFLTATQRKGVPAPQVEKWLAGSRPTGSEFVPGPVRAIYVIEALLAPWRKLCNEKRVGGWLFVNMRSGQSLPRKGSSVVRSPRTKLLAAQRAFIEKYVDLNGLPDRSSLNENLVPYRETRGNCIIATQWRKTYAMYVVRTDRRMIPAVATQFKHVHVAMTESSYIGSNPEILREAKSQMARSAAAFMYRFVTGKEPVAGRIAKLIDEYRELIISVIGSESNPDGLNRLQEWCSERGIRAFSSPHGKCFIGIEPLEAECHRRAGTISWHNSTPNYEMREPALCAGCKLFGVDYDSVDFWVERYRENQTAWLTAKSRGLTKGFRVMQERAAVSANMLRVLGIPLPDIEVP